MGGLVPSVLFFLLQLETFAQWFTIAATCVVAWGVTDVGSNILAQPRLRDRTPGGALKDWEKSKSE